MISYDFGMHQAGVFLHLLLLLLARRAVAIRRRMLVLHLRAIGLNRPYLRGDVCHQRSSYR